MAKEIWKDAVGYVGRYKVSNKGRVKGLNKHKNWKLRTLTPRSNGYYRIKLFDHNGNAKSVSVHRIVETAFIPNPKNKPTVNHKNGIKTDNRIENLEWATYSENMKHSFTIGLRESPMKGVLGISNPASRVIKQYTMDGVHVNTYYGASEAQRETGISCSSINRCCKREFMQAGGFIWRYKRKRTKEPVDY